MNNFSSPFDGLMQADEATDEDAPKSLFDLINSHNLSNSKDDAVTSLSDLTSKLLSVDESSPKEEILPKLPSCFGNLVILGDSVEKDSDDCNTLEAYTKSFLNSKGSNVLQFRKSVPPPKLNGRVLKTQNDVLDCKEMKDKLEKIHRDELLKKTETPKIDLTTALHRRTRTNSAPSPNEVASKANKRSVFVYPVQDCHIDLSSLADETLLYNCTSTSSLGYVVCRNWNSIKLPKKYRKLERTRPYNIAQSFKFDTPPPDEYMLKNRIRNTSISDS